MGKFRQKVIEFFDAFAIAKRRRRAPTQGAVLGAVLST